MEENWKNIEEDSGTAPGVPEKANYALVKQKHIQKRQSILCKNKPCRKQLKKNLQERAGTVFSENWYQCKCKDLEN